MVDFFERKVIKKCLDLHMPRGCGELDTLRRFTNLVMMWHFQYCYILSDYIGLAT